MAYTRKVRTLFHVVRDPLITRIRNGSPIKEACASVGIQRDTYYKWMQRGEAATSGEYRDFYNDVEKAKADSIMESIIVVRKAAKENWQAAAWWLERRLPQEFGRDRQNVNVAIQNNTQVVVSENIKERIKKYESIFEDIES